MKNRRRQNEHRNIGILNGEVKIFVFRVENFKVVDFPVQQIIQKRLVFVGVNALR